LAIISEIITLFKFKSKLLKPCNIFIFGDRKEETEIRKKEIGGLKILIFHLLPYCSFLLPFFSLLFLK